MMDTRTTKVRATLAPRLAALTAVEPRGQMELGL